MEYTSLIFPGDKIDIFASGLSDNSTSYKSSFSDKLTDSMWEITMPVDSGRVVLFQLGTQFDFIIYTKNKTILKSSAIVRQRYRKENMYFLAIELINNLEKIQRRQFFRLPCTIDMDFYEVRYDDKAESELEFCKKMYKNHAINSKNMNTVKSVILDISGGGIRFSLSTPLEEGTYFMAQFSLALEECTQQFNIVCKVINCTQSLDYADRYFARSKFIFDRMTEREKIVRFVFEEERRIDEEKWSNNMKSNILIVDDSALLRRVECDIINSDNKLQATDTCKDGLEALEKLRTQKYDAVILDINMPRMNGLEVLSHLQKESIKTPVVVVSTLTIEGADEAIKSLELGAFDFVTKPNNIIEAKGNQFKETLLRVVYAAVRITPAHSASRNLTVVEKKAGAIVNKHKAAGSNKIVAIASSTGGPKALQSVIPFLPAELLAPVVLVQHMPAGFTKSMAERLNELSQVQVKEASNGEVLKNGVVYIAPGGTHIAIKKSGASHVISFNDMPPISGLKPCANIMFDSLTSSNYDEVVCVVLTGMGADGTNGILSLGKSKPIYVIAQDEKSSVVYGMPRAIYEAGVVDEVVTLSDVAKAITKNVGVK